jgi:hypothetical protein
MTNDFLVLVFLRVLRAFAVKIHIQNVETIAKN